MKKSNWASWRCGKNGWVASRGLSRRWRRGINLMPRALAFFGRCGSAVRVRRGRCAAIRTSAPRPLSL
jgi:hypothetical protein